MRYGSGDADFQKKCFEYFKRLNTKTLQLYRESDMSAIEQYCDRAALIEKSKVVAVPTHQGRYYDNKLFIKRITK